MRQLFAIILAALVATAHAESLLVTGAGLKLRSAPEPTAKVLSVLPFGTEVYSSQSQNTSGTWVSVSADGLKGWVAAKFVVGVQGIQRDTQYLQLIEDQFKKAQNDFGDLLELKNFIERVQFDIRDPRKAKATEELRIASLTRLIELAKLTGKTEWLAKNFAATEEQVGNRVPLTATYGSKSPAVSNIVGNVQIVYADGDRSPQKLRVTYYRLGGIGADMLVQGLLSPQWETVLGGQHDILNNSVLGSARNLLSLFSLSPHGDLLYSPQLRGTYRLEEQEKFRKGGYAPQNLRFSMGGQQNYFMFFPDRDAAQVVAKTDHWPIGFNLFHQCLDGRSTPILWKFMNRAELEQYNTRVREYIQFVTNNRGTAPYLNQTWYGDTEARIANALIATTKAKLPDDFLLVLGQFSVHGGWYMDFLVRQIEVEIATIENTSSHSISVGDLAFSEQDFPALLDYDEATAQLAFSKARVIKPLVSGVLMPREKLVVPTRISFVSTFALPQCLAPTYEGKSIEFPSGHADVKFIKSQESLQENVFPKMTPRYTFGTAWQLRTLKIDGIATKLRQANFNNLNLFLSNEKGSCPYVYTRDLSTGLWLSEGHMLLGATAPSLARSEAKKLQRVPSEVRIVEQEDEVVFIDEVFVEERLADDSVIRHLPDDGITRFVLGRNQERIMTFKSLSGSGAGSYSLVVTGYYVPLGSLNFQDDFLNDSARRKVPPPDQPLRPTNAFTKRESSDEAIDSVVPSPEH